jgi:hypothetical protein
MIPQKSQKCCSILDLSFSVHLKDGSLVPSVNEDFVNTAPHGAINQIGHALSCVIHAYATTSPDEKIFMAKLDIKDGFWHLDCEEGEEWNFAYVLPAHDGPSMKLAIPNSLQMGWIESPPYFCSATNTGWDMVEQYI